MYNPQLITNTKVYKMIHQLSTTGKDVICIVYKSFYQCTTYVNQSINANAGVDSLKYKGKNVVIPGALHEWAGLSQHVGQYNAHNNKYCAYMCVYINIENNVVKLDALDERAGLSQQVGQYNAHNNTCKYSVYMCMYINIGKHVKPDELDEWAALSQHVGQHTKKYCAYINMTKVMCMYINIGNNAIILVRCGTRWV